MNQAKRPGHIVIAIDGPAASGKSSTAQWVARRLGYHHVDSGALYRAATAAQLTMGVPAEAWTEDDVCRAAERVTFVAADGTFVPLVDGGSIEEELRGGEVTRHVSRVARMLRVREWVNGKVRATAASRDVVVDGRDMGTVVFPEATLKVFLFADPWERARRRLISGSAVTRLMARSPRDGSDREARCQGRDTNRAGDRCRPDRHDLLTQEEQVERIVALAKAVTHRPSDTSAVDD
jgi:cytidylate kinase